MSSRKWIARNPIVIASVVCLVALCGVGAVWTGLLGPPGGPLPSAAVMLQTVPIYPGAYGVKTRQSSYGVYSTSSGQFTYNAPEPSQWDEQAGVSFSVVAEPDDIKTFYRNWLVNNGWQVFAPWPGGEANGISQTIYVTGRRQFDGLELVNNWPQIKFSMREDIHLHLFVEPTASQATEVDVRIIRMQPVAGTLSVSPPQNTAPAPAAVPTR